MAVARTGVERPGGIALGVQDVDFHHQPPSSFLEKFARQRSASAPISVLSPVDDETDSDISEVVASNVADTRSRHIQRLHKELTSLRAQRRDSVESLVGGLYAIAKFVRGPSSERWIRSSFASCIFGGVVIVNAILIGIETDMSGPGDNPDEEFWFNVESAFLIIFILELVLRFCAEGIWMFCDAWNVYDTVIVLLGILDTWVLHRNISSTWDGLQHVQIFRLLRLIRFVRPLRIVRLLRFVRELQLLVQGIWGALQALGWAFLLISIVLYVSAIIVTETIRDEFNLECNEDEHDPEIKMWFGSVSASLFTLAQLMTFEEWSDVVRKITLEHERVWLLFFFIPLLCCTNFALLNVVTAVMVEKVFEYAEDTRLQEAKNFQRHHKEAIRKISRLFTNLDEDGDGTLTIDEMRRASSENHAAMKQFQEVGIARHDINTLFSCLDVDPNGHLSAEKFVEGCLRMHGTATSKDLLKTHYDLHRTRKALDIKKLTKHMEYTSWCLQANSAQSCSHRRRRGKRKKHDGSSSAGTPGTPSEDGANARRSLPLSTTCSPPIGPLPPEKVPTERIISNPPSPGLVPATASFCAPNDSADALGLPAHAQELLDNVFREQQRTRRIVEALGHEVRSLRRRAMGTAVLEKPQGKHLEPLEPIEPPSDPFSKQVSTQPKRLSGASDASSVCSAAIGSLRRWSGQLAKLALRRSDEESADRKTAQPDPVGDARTRPADDGPLCRFRGPRWSAGPKISVVPPTEVPTPEYGAELYLANARAERTSSLPAGKDSPRSADEGASVDISMDSSSSNCTPSSGEYSDEDESSESGSSLDESSSGSEDEYSDSSGSEVWDAQSGCGYIEDDARLQVMQQQ